MTAPDTVVDLPSLQIWLHQSLGWIDVTDRLPRHPQLHVDASDIHLDGGVLPVGEHEVRLMFHDMKGRAVDVTETNRILQDDAPI